MGNPVSVQTTDPTAAVTLASPNGDLEVVVWVNEAQNLRWRADRLGVAVVEDSALGIVFPQAAFDSSITFVDRGARAATEFRIDLPAGKRRTASSVASSQTIVIANASGQTLAVDLVAFDDAVGHRFRQLDAFGPGTESTSFVFCAQASKYVQAYDRAGEFQPASEALYTNAVPASFSFPVPEGLSLPALFDTPGGWALVGETGVGSNSDGSRLVNNRGREHHLSGPLPDQVDGVIGEPDESPITFGWKVIVVGELAQVVETNAFEFLAAPTTMTDTSWIRPGRVSWSWWSESDSPRNPERLRDFVDFAAELGWEFSLVDANWNLMPEGTIESLVDYAAQRDVGIFLWYNSGGDHNRVTEQPRDRMVDRDKRRAEMAWLSELGVAGLKIDFFHSDRAWMNRLALELLEDAAEFKLLMNFHGITSPKGWHVTWPHLLTTEAVRGAEQYKFDPFFPVTAPAHNTVLAFTRNVVGPMDYTPMTLSDSDFAHRTTGAHELALGVIFESGLQHPADSPESYRSLGDQGLRLLADLPVAWDEIRLLSGSPSDHVVLARRCHDQWWLAGINARANAVEVTVELNEFGVSFNTVTDQPDSGSGVGFGSAEGSTKFTMEPFGGFVAWPTK